MKKTLKTKVYVSKPMLLILHEKHEKGYYHIPDDAALFDRALTILTDRFESGDWYYKPTISSFHDKGIYSQEDVDKIDNPHLKKEAEMLLKRYLGELKISKREMEEYTRIEEAVKNEDGRAAWELLCERSDGEYERVELTRYGG